MRQMSLEHARKPSSALSGRGVRAGWASVCAWALARRGGVAESTHSSNNPRSLGGRPNQVWGLCDVRQANERLGSLLKGQV